MTSRRFLLVASCLGLAAAFRSPAPLAPLARGAAARVRSAAPAAAAEEPSLPKESPAAGPAAPEEKNYATTIASAFIASSLALFVVLPTGPAALPTPVARTRSEKRRLEVEKLLAEGKRLKLERGGKIVEAKAPTPKSQISGVEEEEGVLLGALPFLAIPAAAAGAVIPVFQRIKTQKAFLAEEASPQKRFQSKD